MKRSLLSLALLVSILHFKAADPAISAEPVRLLNEQPVPRRPANA